MEPILFMHIRRTGGTTFRQLLKKYRHPLPFGGHFYYTQQHSRAEKKIIFIRDPISRALSDLSGHRTVDWIKNCSKEEMQDVIGSRQILYNDHFTRRLSIASRDHDELIGYNKCTNDMLELAKYRINSMTIGVVERYDDSLLLIANDLNWEIPPFYTKYPNSTVNHIGNNEINPDLILLLTESNQLDIQLYKYALDIFNRRFEVKKPELNLDLNLQIDINYTRHRNIKW